MPKREPVKAFEGVFCLTCPHCLRMEAEMEKRHTIRMTADTAKRLKVMAAQCGMTQGGLLQQFLFALQNDGHELTPEEITQAARVVVEYLTTPKGGE